MADLEVVEQEVTEVRRVEQVGMVVELELELDQAAQEATVVEPVASEVEQALEAQVMEVELQLEADLGVVQVDLEEEQLKLLNLTTSIIPQMTEKATPTTEMSKVMNKEMSREPTDTLMLRDFTELSNMLLTQTDSEQTSGQTNLELMAKRVLPMLSLLLKSHPQVSRTDMDLLVVDLVVPEVMVVELEEVSVVQEELAQESAMVELEVLVLVLEPVMAELEVLVPEPVMVEQVLEVEVDSVQLEEQVVLEKQAVKVDIKNLRTGLKEH